MAASLGEWENLVLRLREKARELGVNPGVLEVSILMLEGHPQFWYAPVIKPFEPRRGNTEALRALADDAS